MSISVTDSVSPSKARRAEARPSEKSLGDLLNAMMGGCDAAGIEIVSWSADGLDVLLGPHPVSIRIESPPDVAVYSAPKLEGQCHAIRSA